MKHTDAPHMANAIGSTKICRMKIFSVNVTVSIACHLLPTVRKLHVMNKYALVKFDVVTFVVVIFKELFQTTRLF